MQTINISVFKAKCLAILNEVARTGEGVTILKRGQAIAQILPVVPRGDGYPQQTLLGTVEIVGNVIEPVLPPESWEAESGGK